MPHPTRNVWASELTISGNSVRQLLVPAADEVQVIQDETGESVKTRFGTWRARRGNGVGPTGPLTAVLPTVEGGNSAVRWTGQHALVDPQVVLESFRGAIGFTPPDEEHSLRRPQVAALHSIIGYLSSGLEDPALVVMPTGTGKTETMLAWLVAARPNRLLVLVPSVTLREQISNKFESLGILQSEQIVCSDAIRPTVGRLEHALQTVDEVLQFSGAGNVTVATPSAIQAMHPAVQSLLLAQYSHLIVDEAHHAPATTWTDVIRSFTGKPVLLFTATPFRRDGRTIPGRMVFRFPLREAQRDGYFSKIEFTDVLDLEDDDSTIATAAVERLKADLEQGYEHIVLARVEKKTRAQEVLATYQRIAPQFSPAMIHDGVKPAKRAEIMAALRSGDSRIIVCVDMLGEGFDLPTLKIGAFHDAHRSLSPMLQLIGRLARTASENKLGPASVFVRQHPSQARSPLRSLLKEDPDWDRVLSDVTERATQQTDDLKTFEASFSDEPPEVPVGLLEPKMSALAFRSLGAAWDPLAALDLYGEEILDGLVSVSGAGDVAWFVLETVNDVRWGDVPSLRPMSYTLVAMHLDSERGLLYLHGSDTKRKYDDLAEAVLARAAIRLQGYDTFKVFGSIERLIPTNIGLLDAKDRDKRFSMHVGSDVETALTEAERSHKSNTHVAAHGFEDGAKVSISASLAGRFWSPRSASSLSEWVRWCREQGKKLMSETIDVHSIFRDMIVPIDVKERPAFPLIAMEWPWKFYLDGGTSLQVLHEGSTVSLMDTELFITDHADKGPVKFSIVSSSWEAAFEGIFGDAGVHYRPTSLPEPQVVGRRRSQPLSDWLNDNKPTLFFTGDRMVTGDDRLLAPKQAPAPYPRGALRALDWIERGVSIRTESQGPDRRPESVQAFMSQYLRDTQSFDVLIDDDRSGEAADLVGFRIERDQLHITLVHCKFSTKDVPGARLKDLYEVCGQATRGARWRDGGGIPLLEHLDRRVQNRARATGKSAFDLGDRAALFKIRQRAPQLFPRFTTIIAQPGLSVEKSSDEQLRLIAGAAEYVQTVTKGALVVYCSK